MPTTITIDPAGRVSRRIAGGFLLAVGLLLALACQTPVQTATSRLGVTVDVFSIDRTPDFYRIKFRVINRTRRTITVDSHGLLIVAGDARSRGYVDVEGVPVAFDWPIGAGEQFDFTMQFDIADPLATAIASGARPELEITIVSGTGVGNGDGTGDFATEIFGFYLPTK